MESSQVSPPSDVMSEILSRATLETLGSCRLLSKECNNLTYDSTFMHLHCQRTKTIAGYFIQSLIENGHYSTFVSIDNTNLISIPSIDFLPGRYVKIEASTKQGILFCVNQIYRIPTYYVCKPSTKQWRAIPNPKTRHFTHRIGMVVVRSSPLRFKIVRFSQPQKPIKFDNCYHLRCEIFDSDFWAWKQLEDVRLSINEFLGFHLAVSACGALHWLTTDNNIFAFHEYKESWIMFSLPKPLCEIGKVECMQLVEYEGRLALICMRKDDYMELWVLTNYEQKVWEKRDTMSIEALRREKPHSSPASFYNTDIALMREYNRVIFYKFKDGCWNTVKLHDRPKDIFPFQSDLEPCSLMDRQIQEHRRNLYKSIGEVIGRYLARRPISVFIFLLFAFTLLCFILDL